MTLSRVCALALVGICAALMLKQWRSDLLPLLRIALLVAGAAILLSLASPLLTFLQDLLLQSPVKVAHGTALIKALGIAFLTQLCADVCRECGESGAASLVEMTGKLEILLLCLPLLEELLAAARELLSMGG